MFREYTIIGDKQLQKKKRGHFEQRSVHQAKTLRNLCRWLEQQSAYIASSESSQPNQNLFGVGSKLKEHIFKSNNQINSTVTTRTWVLSKEWIRTWPNTGLVSE